MEERLAYHAESSVVQQLMFNRILSYVRLLSVDGVTVTGFDATTGTLACSLAGVNVVVRVSPREAESEDATGFLVSQRLGG
jgi:hypothetical protein